LWVAENSGTVLFSLLTRLSQDSNIGRTFVTDGSGRHEVSFVLAHALPCAAVSRTAARLAAARTSAATESHTACERHPPPRPLASGAAGHAPGPEADRVADATTEAAWPSWLGLPACLECVCWRQLTG